MNEKKLFKIDNETQADFIRGIKSMFEAWKKGSMGDPHPLTHVRTPDGTNHKIKTLFQALEEYEKETLSVKITLERKDIDNWRKYK